jgi:hypothetical protein
VRLKECDVIGDRPFDPFFFDGQVRKIAALEFRALPRDRAKIGRWRKQLLRNASRHLSTNPNRFSFSADGNEALSAIPYLWAVSSAPCQSRRVRQ